MKFPFAFKVVVYDDDNSRYYEQCGMGICKGYADAVNILEKRYRDDLITIKYLELFEGEDGAVIPMPQKIMTELIDEYYLGVNMFEVRIDEEAVRKV